MRTPIAFGRYIQVVLWATGFFPRWCWIEIEPHTVTVHMSYGFRGSIPRSSVQSVQRLDESRPISIGVHGWRGRWLVNGTRNGLVTMDIDPVARARVLGFPVKLRQLTVSVEDPDVLVAALS